MANANPPEPGPQLGPQPNFELITQGLRQVTNEFANFPNLPPIAQGNAIIQQLQQTQQQMQQTQQQMQQTQQTMQQMQQQQQQMQQQQQQMQQQQQQMQQEIQQIQQEIQQIQQTQQQMMQQMQQMQQTQQQMQQTQQQMQQTMQQMQQQMQQNHLQTQQQIQQLGTDITTGLQAAEHNSIARLQNSGIGRNDSLTPLRELATNAYIQGFPDTPAQLSNMLGPALDHVLTALRLPTNGTTADKKQRLRFYVGLKDIR